MRITDADGGILFDTYWQKRANEYRSFEAVFFANTVTGASAVFRRNVLATALPFPSGVTQGLHDWWIALNAMLSGTFQYIDAPSITTSSTGGTPWDTLSCVRRSKNCGRRNAYPHLLTDIAPAASGDGTSSEKSRVTASPANLWHCSSTINGRQICSLSALPQRTFSRRIDAFSKTSDGCRSPGSPERRSDPSGDPGAPSVPNGMHSGISSAQKHATLWGPSSTHSCKKYALEGALGRTRSCGEKADFHRDRIARTTLTARQIRLSDL